MSYQIIDEPTNGKMKHLSVQPLWPLFGLMLGGSWIAFPWFVINAFAIGCPNRVRTAILAVVALAGHGLLIFAIVLLAQGAEWDQYGVRYALLAAIIWKLGFGYYLYVLQSRTFELYTYFGGQVRNGMIVVIAAVFLGPKLLDNIPPFLRLVLQ